VLPGDVAEEERLLVLATIERLLYEIRYELKSRPELVGVPLADLTVLLESTPQT
jgi:predicted trehalose synthase